MGWLLSAWKKITEYARQTTPFEQERVARYITRNLEIAWGKWEGEGRKGEPSKRETEKPADDLMGAVRGLRLATVGGNWFRRGARTRWRNCPLG